MSNYLFVVTRLGEKEEHNVKAKSEDSAWKKVVSTVDLTNVDKIVLCTVG